MPLSSERGALFLKSAVFCFFGLFIKGIVFSFSDPKTEGCQASQNQRLINSQVAKYVETDQAKPVTLPDYLPLANGALNFDYS